LQSIAFTIFPLPKILLLGYNANKCSYFIGGDHMKMNSGQTIEIIYLDKADKITQRKIGILGIRNGRIRATCLTTDAPRAFLSASVLSWRPVTEKRHAG
jgi:hypothetical protein